jgi:hypothetical protein
VDADRARAAIGSIAAKWLNLSRDLGMFRPAEPSLFIHAITRIFASVANEVADEMRRFHRRSKASSVIDLPVPNPMNRD